MLIRLPLAVVAEVAHWIRNPLPFYQIGCRAFITNLKLYFVYSFTEFDQRVICFLVTASVITLAIIPWDSKPKKCFVALAICCWCIEVHVVA